MLREGHDTCQLGRHHKYRPVDTIYVKDTMYITFKCINMSYRRIEDTTITYKCHEIEVYKLPKQ